MMLMMLTSYSLGRPRPGQDRPAKPSRYPQVVERPDAEERADDHREPAEADCRLLPCTQLPQPPVPSVPALERMVVPGQRVDRCAGASDQFCRYAMMPVCLLGPDPGEAGVQLRSYVSLVRFSLGS